MRTHASTHMIRGLHAFLGAVLVRRVQMPPHACVCGLPLGEIYGGPHSYRSSAAVRTFIEALNHH